MNAGVTGHRQLTKDVRIWVETEFDRLIAEQGVTSGFTSLAIGADQLFAERLVRIGLPYVAVVPSNGYETTFSDAERSDYLRLLAAAATVVVCQNPLPSESAFEQAGHFIVEHSDVILAVWDGLASRGRGGTADVVAYAQTLGRKVVHINTTTLSVGEIL